VQRVALVEAQAPDQLVGQARLARAAGAGDADTGGRSPPRRARSSSTQRRRRAVLERREQLRERAPRRGSRPRIAASDVGACGDRSTSQRITISPIIPARPMRWPSSGL
jgi:hypothetical protein